MTEEFKFLESINCSDREQLGLWLTETESFYHDCSERIANLTTEKNKNPDERSFTEQDEQELVSKNNQVKNILNELEKLEKWANEEASSEELKTSLANNSQAWEKLKTEIGFVVKTIEENENPAQLVEESRTRKSSAVLQMKKQKEREKRSRNSPSRNSVYLVSPSPDLQGEKEREEKSKQNSQEKLKPIKDYLESLRKEWGTYLESSEEEKKISRFVGENEEMMEKLSPLIKASLKKNSLVDYKLFFGTWEDDYPEWKDGLRGERFWFGKYLENCNQESEVESDQVSDLKLEIEGLKNQLSSVSDNLESKIIEISKLEGEFEESRIVAIENTKQSFSHFIDPTKNDQIEEVAKNKLGMKTTVEVQKQLRKYKVPLETWKDTFKSYGDSEQTFNALESYKGERNKFRGDYLRREQAIKVLEEKVEFLKKEIGSRAGGYGSLSASLNEKDSKILSLESTVSGLEQSSEILKKVVIGYAGFVEMDDEDEELVHLGELIEKNFPEIFAKIKEGDEDLEDASSQSASEGDQDSSEEEQKEDSDNDNESNKSFQGERAGTDNGENSDSEGEGSVAGSERSEITNEQEEEVDLQVDETVTSADNDNSEQELSDQEDSEEQPEQVALIESQEQKSV